MSFQRRRGEPARIWKSAVVVDSRGNTHHEVVATGPYVVRAAFIPQRSSKAEAPGEVTINVVRMIVDPDMADVNLWSRVEYAGSLWDVVTPPSLHGSNGIRGTRHWSIDLRQRP